MKEAKATIDGKQYAIKVKDLDNSDKIRLAMQAPSRLMEAAERGERPEDLTSAEETVEFMEYVLVEATEFTDEQVEQLTLDQLLQLGAVTLNTALDDEEGNDSKKRVRRVRATEEIVECIFKGEASVVAGMPDDASLENFEYDPSRNEIQFIFSSSEWEPIGEGEKIPLHEVAAVSLEWEDTWEL